MVQLNCPWCEEALAVDLAAAAEELCCPECRTVWLLDAAEEDVVELAAVA